MKLKFILIALVLTVFASASYSQMTDNWKWMNPSPQGNTLFAVDFVDNSIGYSAGDYGTILKTTDGGAIWNKINSGTEKDLISASFVNSNTGFVGGYSQLVRKTTDGGQSWQSLQLPVSGNWDTAYSIMDIKFLNTNVGYVAGFFQLESKIWKTTDGGNTWATQSTGSFNYIQRLYMLDENTGFAMGGSLGGEVIRTTNGGSTWEMIYQGSYTVYSMYFLNSMTGVIGCENGRIYRTTDGGSTWNFALCPSGLDVMTLQFTNATTGFGFGTGSVYIKTTDGGLNWDELSLGTGGIRMYYAGDMTPSGNLYAVGTYGAMIRSTNAGVTFSAQPYVTEHSICDIEFIDQYTGYAVAGYGEGDILKTTNAGETWVSQVSSYTLPLYGIAFTSANTGYLAGSINIKKTTNGGTNWIDVYTSTTNEIFGDVFFTNSNTGYVVGSYGRMLKTTNAGLNWSSSNIPNGGTFIGSIYFVNDNTGFATGDNNAAVKTTDAGATWNPMFIASGFATINNIFFTDINTGYASSGAGLYKTTNSGANWFQLGAPSGGYSNVQFRGNFGYAVAGSGKIVKSTDGGNSWITQPTVTENSLYALYFNSDNYIYAGGVRGTMIKTIPSEMLLTPITGNGNETPKSFYLEQNYPNPFNPVTTIKFGISKPGFVAVKVFDITGKVISELINSSMNPGSYEVKWDGSGFSSGVYFYSIKTNEFSETKKMILVK